MMRYSITFLLIFTTLSSPLAMADGGCDNICNSLVNKDGKILGIPGQGGGEWDSADDTWCSVHDGQAGNGSAYNGTGANDLASSPGCTYKVTNSDVSINGGNTQTACDYASTGVKRCKNHNTQLEQQCLAYETAGDGDKWQKILLALDIATAGTCGSICAGMVTNLTVQQVCGYASLVAGGTEIIATISMKNSNVGKLISGIGAGVGIYEGNAITGVGGKIASKFGSSAGGGASGTPGAATTSGPVSAGEGGLSSGVNEGLTPGTSCNMYANCAVQPTAPTGGTNPTQAAGANKDGIKKGNACFAAASFALLAGMRAYNMMNVGKTKDDACSQVQQLQSRAPAVNWAAYTQGSAVAMGTGGLGSGAGAGMSGLGNPAPFGRSPDGIAGVPPVALQAVDGGLLSKTGLMDAMAPAAKNSDAIANAVKNGGAGGAVGQALGAGANTPIGQQIAALAQAGQEHAIQIMDAVPGTAVSFGGGGGGGSPSKSSNPFGSLSSLFGGGGSGGDRVPASVTQYAPADTDIWHSKSTDNLFQIVSTRIEKVSSRVR